MRFQANLISQVLQRFDMVSGKGAHLEAGGYANILLDILGLSEDEKSARFFAERWFEVVDVEKKAA